MARSSTFLFRSLQFPTAVWPATALLRLCSANESAREFPFHQRRDFIHVEAALGQKLARVLDVVDPRCFDIDIRKTCVQQLRPVIALLQSSGHAAGPQQHTSTDRLRYVAADNYIRYREATTGPQHPPR